MAIHLNSLRPEVVRLPPMPSRTRVRLATTSQTAATASRSTATAPDPAADFRALFGGSAAATTSAVTPAASGAGKTGVSTAAVAPAAAASTNPNAAPTVQSVFGSNPWLDNPTGVAPDGTTYSYNPIYFATQATAQTVAQMVGGTVVQDSEFTKNTPANPFHQSQTNYMVQLPNGGLVNPGLIASFYTHGYPQWMVDQMVNNEVAGAAKIPT